MKYNELQKENKTLQRKNDKLVKINKELEEKVLEMTKINMEKEREIQELKEQCRCLEKILENIRLVIKNMVEKRTHYLFL